MDTGLTGRTAVVPGATAGLGLAVAQSLAAEGARVLIAGRRGELVRQRADELAGLGVEADLTDPAGVDAVIEAAGGLGDGVDVLVLNGGGPPPGVATEQDPASVEDAVGRLLTPHVRLVSAFLPGMRERGWGRIIAVGSTGVQQPIPNLALSNIGRAALAGYLKSLATDVAADGVTVNMVLPGRIDTDRVASLDGSTAERTGKAVEEVRREAESAIPVGRYGRPDEFAAAVTFLASEAASYVTGEQLRCDGGMVKAY